MRVSNNDILSININSESEFVLENILQYENLESLELTNICLDSFLTIKKLLDELNFSKIKMLNCDFMVNQTNVKIKTIDELVQLSIISSFSLNLPEIKDFFTNLPESINCIYIECTSRLDHGLEGSFTNLPVNLKKIEIQYNIQPLFSSFDDSVAHLEMCGRLNCLFGVKLPFGCEMILYVPHFTELYKLKVIYVNNEDDELTLVTVDYVDPTTKTIVEKKKL